MKTPHLLPLLVALATFAPVGCSPEAKQARHLERGNEYFAEEQYREATLEYLNVLRMDRSNETAVVNSAIAFTELGDVQRAVPFLRAAVVLRPDDLDLRWKLAGILRAVGALPLARVEALEILERDPHHANGLLLLADTARSPEEVAEALARLDAHAETLSDSARFHLARADLYLRQGEVDLAEAAGQQAVEIAPDDPGVHLAMAAFYAGKGDREAADKAYRTAMELAPPASQVPVRFAAFLYAGEGKDEAREILEQVLEADPDFLPALEQAGEFDLVEGRLDACRDKIDRMLRQVPEHFGARALEARLMYARGEYGDAVEAFEGLRDKAPGSARLRAQMATAYVRDGRLDEARTEFREALRRNPTMVPAYLQLAELDIRAGNPAAAVRVLETLLARQPELPEAMLLLSRAYLAEDELPKAEEVLQALSTARPDDPGVHYLLGRVHEQQDALDTARDDYQKALEAQPRFAQALARLVGLDLREEDNEAAVRRIEAALEDQPDSPGLHRLMGRVLELAGDTAEAEAAYRRAIDLAPESAASYVALGRMLAADPARLEDALQQAEEAVRINEGSVAALMMAGMLHEGQGNVDQALERYEKLLAVRPDFVPALNNAAYLYVTEKGDLDRAFDLARRARDLDPQDPASADTLGWIVYQRGDYPWALTLIREGAEHFSEHPEVQTHLGWAWLANGDEAAARAAFAKALESGGDELEDADQLGALVALLDLPVAEVEGAHRPYVDAVLAFDADNPSARVRMVMIEEADSPDDAEEAFGGILADFPAFRPAALGRLRLYAGAWGDREAAVDAARAARELFAGDPEIAALAGQIALRVGDYTWADSLLREAAANGTGGPSLDYLLALSSYIQGDTSAAEERLAELPAQGFPEADEAARFRAMLTALRGEGAAPAVTTVEGSRLHFPASMIRAGGLVEAGEAAQALEIYQSLLAAAPGFVPAAAAGAALYADVLDQPEEARKLAMQVRLARPDDPGIAALVGRVLYKAGDTDDATRLLEEAAGKVEDDALSRYYLGLCYQDAGKVEQAKGMLEQALALEPGAAWASEAREAIAGME